MSGLNSGKRRSRFRSMIWSLAFIVVAGVSLPTASVVLEGFGVTSAFAQVEDGNNQRSNFWRAVRQGDSGYSSIKGSETGNLINDGGQAWRESRTGNAIKYAGWSLIGVLVALLAFRLVRGRISLNQHISGRRVERWNFLERLMHWYTAVLFVVLAITGVSMLFGRSVLIPIFGKQVFAAWAGFSINVHNAVGPFFSLGVLLMFVFWLRHNIPRSVDFEWFAKGGGIIGKSHPSAYKANGGEKVWFWIVAIVGLGFVCWSGFVLIGWTWQYLNIAEPTRALLQTYQGLHMWSALVWIGVFFGHAYIGTFGTEGALEGMTKGSVSEEWAIQHHDLWFQEMQEQERGTTRVGDSVPVDGSTATSRS